MEVQGKNSWNNAKPSVTSACNIQDLLVYYPMCSTLDPLLVGGSPEEVGASHLVDWSKMPLSRVPGTAGRGHTPQVHYSSDYTPSSSVTLHGCCAWTLPQPHSPAQSSHSLRDLDPLMMI